MGLLVQLGAGDVNLTIESMVKLARAAGGELRIQITDEKASARIWDKIPSQKAQPINKEFSDDNQFPSQHRQK